MSDINDTPIKNWMFTKIIKNIFTDRIKRIFNTESTNYFSEINNNVDSNMMGQFNMLNNAYIANKIYRFLLMYVDS